MREPKGSGFAGAVALWWLYFDQSADEAAQRIAADLTFP
jgi:low temperature requirement protein LtrA